MKLDSRFEFHEATLSGVRRTAERTLCLSFEGVWTRGGAKSLNLFLSGVKNIMRDDVPISDMTMELPDAEVVMLEAIGHVIQIILIWNDFSDHRRETRSYEIECESATIELADQLRA